MGTPPGPGGRRPLALERPPVGRPGPRGRRRAALHDVPPLREKAREHERADLDQEGEHHREVAVWGSSWRRIQNTVAALASPAAAEAKNHATLPLRW